MDFLFLMIGLVCLAETVYLFMGKDFLIFMGSSVNRDEFDLQKVYAVERWLFAVDAVASIAIARHWGGPAVEIGCMAIVFVTLGFHTYVFKSAKFKK